MAKKKAAAKSRRYAGRRLRPEAIRAIQSDVIDMLKGLKGREEIESYLRNEYSVTEDKACFYYEEGRASFESQTGITPAQVDHAIERRALDILVNEDATDASVLRASSMLKKLRGSEGEADADLPEKLKLWMDYIDQLPVEAIDQFIDDHRKGLFDIRAISEGTLESMLEVKKKKAGRK